MLKRCDEGLRRLKQLLRCVLLSRSRCRRVIGICVVSFYSSVGTRLYEAAVKTRISDFGWYQGCLPRKCGSAKLSSIHVWHVAIWFSMKRSLQNMKLGG